MRYQCPTSTPRLVKPIRTGTTNAVTRPTAPSEHLRKERVMVLILMSNPDPKPPETSECVDDAQHHWRTDDHEQAGQYKCHHWNCEQYWQPGCALFHTRIAFCPHFAGNHPQGFGKRRTEAKRLLESGDEPTQIVQTRSFNEIVERLT